MTIEEYQIHSIELLTDIKISIMVLCVILGTVLVYTVFHNTTKRR